MAKRFGCQKMINHLIKHQKTKIIPLRWIGNFFGGYASDHLLKAVNLDEELDIDLGFKYKYHAKMWVILNKPYEWWGTYYLLDMEEWGKDIANR
jgi:hypothetical protein